MHTCTVKTHKMLALVTLNDFASDHNAMYMFFCILFYVTVICFLREQREICVTVLTALVKKCVS